MPRSSDHPRRLPGARLAAAICLVYAVAVLGFFALAHALPHWPPLLALAGYFAPWLFVPLVAMLPLALVSRSRAALAATLAALALAAVVYGPFYLPRRGPSPVPAGSSLTIMTFNVHAGYAAASDLIEAIAGEGADILAVEELVPSVAADLRAGLSGRYAYAVLDAEGSGSGLFSRYPIVASEWFHPAGFGRAALQATLDVDGTPWQVLVIHPLPPGISWSRGGLLPMGLSTGNLDEEMADIARRASALAGPVVALGDFNMSDQSPAYRSLAGVLGDAYREAGWGLGLTFPNGLRIGPIAPGPLVRLDYVFHSAGLYAESARVGCQGGSDHCYVVVRMGRMGLPGG